MGWGQKGSGADSQGSLFLKTHSHRPSDQGTTQKKGRLDKAGPLLGLEGSLTSTQVKWKGEGTRRERAAAYVMQSYTQSPGFLHCLWQGAGLKASVLGRDKGLPPPPSQQSLGPQTWGD